MNEKQIVSQAFHAGRSEPDKRNIQDDFLTGKIPVICAANAFGMGIDKKDIRLVLHADIPGSLENYLQEAGRAGRDTAPADCILLYEQEAIVATPPEKNILVLAGPGSGKTKTIVHRCAWLIKAKSVDPASILVLCFNHQAMIELRKRIRMLTGSRANFVTAMTYNGFAMRLTGRSFLEKEKGHTGKNAIGFDTIIDEAVDILNGKREITGTRGSQDRNQ